MIAAQVILALKSWDFERMHAVQEEARGGLSSAVVHHSKLKESTTGTKSR
jgi:hypothetical protein